MKGKRQRQITDPDELPFCSVRWQGWEATLDDLLAAGWCITHRCNHYHPEKCHTLQLREPASKMLCVVKLTAQQWNDLRAGQTIPALHMVQERNAYTKAPRTVIEDDLVHLTAQDIPMLLETVVALQEPQRQQHRKAHPLPVAEIIKLIHTHKHSL